MSTSHTVFKQRLDEEHTWPGMYLFKFVVPKEKQQEIIQLFPDDKLTTKLSKEGNYISITVHKHMQSSDEVIEIYERAHKVEGVIAL